MNVNNEDRRAPEVTFRRLSDLKLEKLDNKPDIEVLLCVVNDNEFKAALDVFFSEKEIKTYLERNHKYYIDSKEKLAMVRIKKQGSGGKLGAQAVIGEAIDVLDPKYVINIGVAFGKDKKKQCLGDILVSEQIVPYDLVKITDKGSMEFRGNSNDSSTKLFGLFVDGKVGWKKLERLEDAKIIPGKILTGSVLLNNKKFKKTLFGHFKDAIGGEMEGEGVYVAAAEKKKEYIVVKSICDWGDGTKKKDWQPACAMLVASYAKHVIYSDLIEADSASRGVNRNSGDISNRMEEEFTKLCNMVINDLRDENVVHIVKSYKRIPNRISNSKDLFEYLNDSGEISSRNVDYLIKMLNNLSKTVLADGFKEYKQEYGLGGGRSGSGQSISKGNGLRLPVRNNPSRSQNYITREKEPELKRLCALPRDHRDRTRFRSICGQAGAGKSQMAMNFCEEVEEEFDIVWFQSSDGYDTLLLHYQTLLKELGITCENKELHEYAKEFKDKVTQAEIRWLIVLDNFEKFDVEKIYNLFPKKGGIVLLTARDKTPLAANATLKIGLYSEEEIYTYFVEILGQDLISRDKAVEIGHILGNNPFAVSVAAWYLIDKIDAGLVDAKELVEKRMDTIVNDLKGKVRGEETINSLFDSALERLKSTDAGAWRLMQKLSVLNADGISGQVAVGMEPSHDIEKANEQLTSMITLSLIEKRDEGATGQMKYVMHRLMRDMVQEKGKREGSYYFVVEGVIDDIRGMWEWVYPTKVESWKLNEELGEHMEELWNHIDSHMSMEMKGLLLHVHSFYIYYLMNVKGNLMTSVLKIEQLEGRVEEGIPNVYKERVIYVRGWYHDRKNEFDIALTHYQKGMELCDSDVDRSRYHNVIAGCYQDMDKYSEALAEYDHAMELYKKRHNGVEMKYEFAVNYNNMGICYYKMKKYDEALVQYKKSLGIQLHLLGIVYDSQDIFNCDMDLVVSKATPAVASTLNNIGSCYKEMKEYDTATKYYNLTLKIRNRLYPKDEHPSIADTYRNMANLYYFDTKQYDKAAPLFQKAHQIFQNYYGDDHPSTMYCKRKSIASHTHV